ncbi:diuretic hormone class 2-like [Artemia franciscana]|uniref:diuretic hormone class 2-like n=1 Tax=Artemia franciscana TaxID=6661 RepID=UPI0032D9C61F
MRNYFSVCLLFAIAVSLVPSWSEALPAGSRSHNLYVYQPKDRPIFHMLARLGHALRQGNNLNSYSPTMKRGIDFGLGRSFSGSKAAKHYMGLAAAKYAVGPGKR